MKPLLIGGRWVETARSRPNINPSDTDDVIDGHADAGPAEAQAAIAAACQAQPEWAAAGPERRHDVLRAASAEIWDRQHEIARHLSREEGKTLPEAVAETARASRIFGFFAGEALRFGGDSYPDLHPGVDAEVVREPVGVVAAITPWNFPIAIPAWKTAPALAFGNSVVLKPAELTPGTAWLLADILHRAGVPAGAFNLLTGPGSAVGQAMLEDSRLDAVTFTGSQAVGARVAEACARYMRRCQLEMGGKNPLVVLADADLELAATCAIDGAFFSSGQRCTASSRIIVEEAVHSRFVEMLVARLRALKVGPALEPETQIGPLASAAQLETVESYLALGRQEGAHLRAGGERLTLSTPGHFLSPALFTDTAPNMRICREEIFGPVATVERVRDYEAALAAANDTRFGLSAGICTTSLSRARHFKRHAEAGMVMVNLPTAGVDYRMPFGGRKASNLGPREQGVAARDFFTALKTVYVRA